MKKAEECFLFRILLFHRFKTSCPRQTQKSPENNTIILRSHGAFPHADGYALWSAILSPLLFSGSLKSLPKYCS